MATEPLTLPPDAAAGAPPRGTAPTDPAQQYECLRCGRPVLREGAECYECRRQRPECLQATADEDDDASSWPWPVKLGLGLLLIGVLVFVARLSQLGGPSELWSVNLRSPVLRLVAAGNVVLAATDAPELVGIDQDNGKVLWRYQGGERSGVAEAVAGHGRVCFPADRDHLCSLDLRTGDRLWLVEVGAHATVPVLLRDLTLVVADGALVALDAQSGQVRWRTIPAAGPAGGGLLSDGRTVYLGYQGASRRGARRPNQSNGLLAIDLRSQQELWTCELPGDLLPAITLTDDTVGVVVQVPGGFEAIGVDRVAGRSRWTRVVRQPVLAVSEGVVVLAEDDGLVAVEARSGTVRWRRPLEPQAAPVVAGNGEFYLGTTQELLALRAKTGSHRWSLALRDEPAAPVAYGGAAVFVAGRAGPIHAFHCR